MSDDGHEPRAIPGLSLPRVLACGFECRGSKYWHCSAFRQQTSLRREQSWTTAICRGAPDCWPWICGARASPRQDQPVGTGVDAPSGVTSGRLANEPRADAGRIAVGTVRGSHPRHVVVDLTRESQVRAIAPDHPAPAPGLGCLQRWTRGLSAGIEGGSSRGLRAGPCPLSQDRVYRIGSGRWTGPMTPSISPKYAQRCFAQAMWRLSRGCDLEALVSRLLLAAAISQPRSESAQRVSCWPCQSGRCLASTSSR